MQALLRQEQKWQERGKAGRYASCNLNKTFQLTPGSGLESAPFYPQMFFFFCLPLVVAAYGEYSQSTGNGYRRTHEFKELFIHSFIYVSIYKLLSALDLKMPCIIVPWVYLICFP